MADDTFTVHPVPPAYSLRFRNHAAPIEKEGGHAKQQAQTEPQADPDEYSLAGIQPEAAKLLLLLPLMQQAPVAEEGNLNLGNLRNALQKRSEGQELSEVDGLVLERAGAIVAAFSAPSTLDRSRQRYEESEQLKAISEFHRAAKPFATPLGKRYG